MKHLGVVLCFGLVLVFTCPTSAALVLNEDLAYDFEWTGFVQHESPIDILVKNNLDPARWKDWRIIIGVLSTTPVAEILVDYDNTPDHSQPITFPVQLAAYGPWEFEGQVYNAFYADTFLVGSEWEKYGTTPVGSGGLYPIGNPQWLSFHFEVIGEDPLVYIKDKCIPEPATIAILGLGAIALLRKRS
jgi:hypothetical protein